MHSQASGAHFWWWRWWWWRSPVPGSDIRSPRLVVCAHELLAIGARERARFISVRPEHVLLVKARIGQRIAQLSA